jgi:hypothetical protein
MGGFVRFFVQGFTRQARAETQAATASLAISVLDLVFLSVFGRFSSAWRLSGVAPAYVEAPPAKDLEACVAGHGEMGERDGAEARRPLSPGHKRQDRQDRGLGNGGA